MQTFLVIVAILAAVTYLTWQFYRRFFKKESKCDGCAMGKTTDASDVSHKHKKKEAS